MQRINARWKKTLLKRPWAFFLLAAITTLCLIKCTRKPPPQPSDGEEQSILLPSDASDEELGKADFRCQGQSSKQAPVLYAHFLEPTATEDMCTEDAFYSGLGAINCAPGPVLLEHGNAIDENKEWVLPAMPDYFAWHLGRKSSFDEAIYIANASGFPVKAQTVKLENEHDSTLVLFPKSPLQPGAKYYLYLVLNNTDSQKRWIQPIAASSASIPTNPSTEE